MKEKVPILIFSLACISIILAVTLFVNPIIFSGHIMWATMAISIITAITVIVLYLVNIKKIRKERTGYSRTYNKYTDINNTDNYCLSVYLRNSIVP